MNINILPKNMTTFFQQRTIATTWNDFEISDNIIQPLNKELVSTIKETESSLLDCPNKMKIHKSMKIYKKYVLILIKY